ncbi:MAG: deiodinase-like protein [Pseudomonadota bacterium]
MSELKYNYETFQNEYYDPTSFISGAPRVGECATDFEAETLDRRKVRLSDFAGQRIILEMGSITCPMFGGNIEGMNGLAAAHPDVAFLVLYTREAHPGRKRASHSAMDQKRQAARDVSERVSGARTILIDDVDGTAHRQWGEFPNSSWIIDEGGVVIYRMDWSQATVLQRVLEAPDLEAAIAAEHERNHVDMAGAKALHTTRYMRHNSGVNAILHVVRELFGMRRRHTDTDAAYAAQALPPPRPERQGPCWSGITSSQE